MGVSSSSQQAPTPPLAPLSATISLLRNTHDFFVRDAQREYGDIFTLNAGLTRVVVISSPEHIDHVLRRNAQNYGKGGAMWDMVRGVLGNGLVVSEGEVWRSRRRMMQPHFTRDRLAGLTDAIAQTIDEVIDTWTARTHDPVDLAKLCSHMTMLAMVRSVFGTEIDERDIRTVATNLNYILNFITRGLALQSLPRWFPMPGRSAYARNLQSLHELLDRLIARRRAQPPGDDLLYMLLSLLDEDTNEGLDNRAIHDEVINLFVAGYETTATATAWTLHALAERPQMAARVHAELMEVTGGAPARVEHLDRLVYTRMVVKEGLRNYPAIWQLTRTAHADDEVGGYRIPAGSYIMLSLTGALHDPDAWPAPLRFDPLRHTPELEAERPKWLWLPFGAGQRMCIGYQLALMESTLMLAAVSRAFELRPVPGRPPVPKLSLTLMSKDGIWLDLKAR